MHHVPTAVFAFAIALGASAQTPQFTSQSLKAAVQSAHTPAEYNRLAGYFHERSVYFKHLSDEQASIVRQELDSPTAGIKYPTAVERARRMQEYYLEQSRKAHEQSQHFKSMSERTKERDQTK